MYSKPSFQDNLFDRVDVDIEEFEVSIKCPKKNRSITKHNYSTRSRITTTKNFYIIKRPIRGNLRLKLFCHFCEKYYYLKIKSEERQKRKKKLHFLTYLLLMLSFWYSNLPIGFVRYIVWIYLFYKVYQTINISFVGASKKHIARIVRIWEPTKVN